MPRGSIITELPPPRLGAISAETVGRLPPEAVVAETSKNVILRDGELVSRPGYTPLTNNLVTGTPLGVFFYLDGATKRTLVGTTSDWYSYATGTYTALSLSLSGNAADGMRWVVWPTGSANIAIGVNGATRDAPQKWDGTTAAALGGSPPKARDITISSNRVILGRTLESAVEQLYRVRWTDFNTYETWTAANFVDLSDTYDPIVGVRALTRTAFVVYKEASQWVGTATTGTYPFRFELQDQKPGPASPAAIIAVEGRHYYFGQDMSVYTFDGNRCTHIGESIRRRLINTVNYDNIARIFAVYMEGDREIWWFYPSLQSSNCERAISYHIDAQRFFFHEFGDTFSCGGGWDRVPALTWDDLAGYTWDTIASYYPTWDSFGSASARLCLLGQTTGTIHKFGGVPSDNGDTMTCRWTTGLLPLAGHGKRARVQSADHFLEDASRTASASIVLKTSDTLVPEDLGTVQTDTVSLVTTDEIQTTYDQAAHGIGSGNAEAKFTQLDYTVTGVGAGQMTYRGGVVRSFPLETA